MQFRYAASATGVAVLLALSLGHLTAAHAEAPLTVDGAEAEQPGSFEWSVEVFQDDSLRGGEVELGYIPVENLEVELELGAGEDQDTDPRARESEYGLSLKWVPKQTGEGVSYGVKLRFGREIEDDRQGEKEETDRIDLTGVFSYAIHRGPTSHLNLGVAREKQDNSNHTFMVWGLGMD